MYMFVFQYGRMAVAEYCNYKSNQIRLGTMGDISLLKLESSPQKLTLHNCMTPQVASYGMACC